MDICGINMTESLYKNMLSALDAGLVTCQESPDGLQLFKYSQECVQSGTWTKTTRIARGIIFNKHSGMVICKGYNKFFNMEEQPETLSSVIRWNEQYNIYEKMDGSLIYIWHHDGKWQTSTNGAFRSEQAIAGRELLKQYDTSYLPIGHTILCELIHPDFRIVLDYRGRKELVLLSVVRQDWSEFSKEECDNLASDAGFSRPRIYNRFDVFAENEEGYVLHFPATNFRVKVKSPQYVRVHRLLEYVTPKRILALLRGTDKNENSYEEVIKWLPSNLASEFDDISASLRQRHEKLTTMAQSQYYRVRPDPSGYKGVVNATHRKQQALWILKNVPKRVQSLVFRLLDAKDIIDPAWKIIERELTDV